MTGYAEELGLEKWAAMEHELRAAELWVQRNYKESLRESALARQARAHIAKLEGVRKLSISGLAA